MEEKLESKLLIFNFFFTIFSKKTNLKESLKNVFDIWRKEPTSDKVIEELYLLTATEFEYCISENLKECLYELEDEDIVELIRFFYMTYQRVSEKENCLSLNSSKIFPIHQDIIEKKGIGILHRALFTTQKRYRKNLLKTDRKKQIEDIKIYKKKIDNKFAKISNNISDSDKNTLFIEQNINYSSIIKRYVKVEKKNNPENYINLDKTINNVENLEKNMNSKENSDFILSLLGKCLAKNNSKIYISKEKTQKVKCIEYISMQSLFSLMNQKKYEFHFDFGKDLNKKILNDLTEQENFLKIYKNKIAKKLGINPDNFIFTDIHHGCIGVHSSIINPTEDIETKIKNLEGKDFITKVEEKPILEELQIDSSILDSKGDKYKDWSINSIRGGEKYIPPIGWYGIGLKVDNLYENYNNWLSNNNLEGEFAVAYLGLNNFLNDKDIFINDLNPVFYNIKKMLVDKLYRDEKDVKNDNSKCGDGIVVFQNPEYAENTAGIVDILGFRMKIIIMCRINPKKIRQPECFTECWILNPTPDEIRPYRILIKKIPISPLTEGLTNNIIISNYPIDYIISAIKSDDSSILNMKYDPLFEKEEVSKINGEYLSGDIFVIRLYSSIYFKFINEYLRNRVVLKNFGQLKGLTETQLNSWIYCLQKALLNYKNVKDDTIVYRAIRYFKFPPNIGIGSKFYLREFLSTSKDKNFSEDWMRNKSGTLLKIKIKNNGTNGYNNYCSFIEDITYTKKQEEVLFASHCYYTITKINRNDFIDNVDLICEGLLIDAIPNDYFNEISIDYKINGIKEIKLFGDKFVENNKKKCHINIEGKEYELCSIFNIDENKNNYIKGDTLKIKLKGINNITDMNSIFKDCSSLLSSDIYKWNTKNITNMSGIFCNCEHLTYLPDISQWDTRNVTDMSSMFLDCKSLLSLPDISKWETKNVTNMNFIFLNCSSLSSLPDISKWNTSNVTEMANLFYGCSSLLSIPDISKWNTSNNTTINGIFTKCISLKNIPDISNWDTSKVYDMNGIFFECSSLKNIPDISKWNTSKAFYMEYMFFGCSSLESLPDISKWDTTHTFVINNMFDGCKESFDVPHKFMSSFIELKKKLPLLLYIKEKSNNKIHEIIIDRKESVNNLKGKIEKMLNIKIINHLILLSKSSFRIKRRKKVLDNEFLTLEDSEINGGDTILIE